MSDAAKSGPVARRFHKPENASSNPSAATSLFLKKYGHTLDEYPRNLMLMLLSQAKKLECERNCAREERDMVSVQLRMAIDGELNER